MWLYGVRNPFRFAVDPATDDIWFGEVGWNTWEEIDHGVKGGNYGWPCFEGNAVNVTLPVRRRVPARCSRAAVSSRTSRGTTPSGTAAIGGPFYTGTLYPSQYQGNYFYADYTGNFIKRIVFDAQHNPVSATSFATGVAAPVSLEVGPDGMIYYNSFTTGEIRRIRYNGPVAVASATPTYGLLAAHRLVLERGSVNPGGGTLDLSVELRRRARPRPPPTRSTPTRRPASRRSSARLTVTSSVRPDVVCRPCRSSSAASRPFRRSPRPSTGRPCSRARRSPTKGRPPIPTRAPRALGTEVDGAPPSQHARAHVRRRDRHVGELRRRGSRADRHVLLRDHPRGDRQQRSEVDHQRHAPGGDRHVASVDADRSRASRRPDWDRAQLSWTASTDNARCPGYRVERCQGVGLLDFAQVAQATDDEPVSTWACRRRRATAIGWPRSIASGNVSGYSAVVSVTTPCCAAGAGGVGGGVFV